MARAVVCVDVGTTPRKKLTRTQRLKIFEAHGGICALCGLKIIDRNWIIEHLRALELGGADEPANMGPAHKKCADLKTNGADGDHARASKAKRMKKAQFVRKEPKNPLVSRGFAKAEKKSTIGRVRIKKGPLPPPRGFR